MARQTPTRKQPRAKAQPARQRTPSTAKRASSAPPRRPSPVAAAKKQSGNTLKHSCTMAAGDFWRLRDNASFEAFAASKGGNVHEILSYTERKVDGLTHVTRVSRVRATSNPVPKALRGMLGCGDDFGFEQTETYVRERCDRDHPLIMRAKPAILADRITVTGTQWVESTGDTSCDLCFELQVVGRVGG